MDNDTQPQSVPSATQATSTESVNSAPVPTQQETVSVQTNDEKVSKPKKKKHRFLKFLAVALLLIVALAIISKLTRKEHDDILSMTVNRDGYFKYVEGELEIAYNKGEISANDYINTLFDVYSGKADYDNLPTIGSFSDLYDFSAEHVDELSEETAGRIIKHFFGVVSSEDEKVGLDGGIKLANSSEETPKDIYTFTNLDHAVLSSNKRFIVYYTEDGLNGTTREYAENIASILENTADTYGEMTGYEYKYEQRSYTILNALTQKEDSLISSFTTAKGKEEKVLESEGISKDYIDTAMPVYITATGRYEDVVAGKNKGTLAAYTSSGVMTDIAKIFSSFGDLSIAILQKELGNDWELYYYPLVSIYQVPYINISKYGEQNDEILRFVAAHEMFHHFQSYICGDGEYAECMERYYQDGVDSFNCNASMNENYEYVSGSRSHMACNGGKNTLEGMANVAAYIATKPSEYTGVSNNHAAASVMFYEHGPEQDATDGYSAWVYLYYYTQMVDDGFKVAMNSSKYKDPNNYLIDHLESKQQGQDIMNTYIERMLTLDYPSKAMYPIAFDEIVQPKAHGGFKDDGEVHSEGTIRGYSYIRYGNASEMDENKYIYIHKLDGNSINFNLLVNDGGGWKSVIIGEELVVPISKLQQYTEFAIAVVDGLVDGIDDTGLYEYKLMTEDEVPDKDLLNKIAELLDKSKPFWADSDVVYCSSSWTETDEDDGDSYSMWLEYKMKFKGDELKGLSIDGTMAPQYYDDSFSWAVPVTAIFTWANDKVEDKYPHSISWYPWHDNQIDFHWRFLSHEYEYLQSDLDGDFANNKVDIVRAFSAKGYTCGVK